MTSFDDDRAENNQCRKPVVKDSKWQVSATGRLIGECYAVIAGSVACRHDQVQNFRSTSRRATADAPLPCRGRHSSTAITAPIDDDAAAAPRS